MSLTMTQPRRTSDRPAARPASELRTLIAAARIRRRVRELAAQIVANHPSDDLVLVGVLKGAFVFLADLVRELGRPVRVDFLRVSSYHDRTTTSGTVRVDFDVTQPIRGQQVILVEDIIDTGLTARAVLDLLKSKRPAGLELCTLLHKPARKHVEVPIDYLGFTIPNKFVVGYGLDSLGLYRNLPYLGYLEPPPG